MKKNLQFRVVVWLEVILAMGLLSFVGETWAVEAKSLVHPVLDNFEKQPSRMLLRHPVDQDAAQAPEIFNGRIGAIAKMNERLAFQERIQDLKNPVAYKTQRLELHMPNPNQRTKVK